MEVGGVCREGFFGGFEGLFREILIFLLLLRGILENLKILF